MTFNLLMCKECKYLNNYCKYVRCLVFILDNVKVNLFKDLIHTEEEESVNVASFSKIQFSTLVDSLTSVNIFLPEYCFLSKCQ